MFWRTILEPAAIRRAFSTSMAISLRRPIIRLKTYYPQPDWAEQRPEEWWQAVKDATHEVVAKSGVAPKDVKAISSVRTA